MAGLKINIDFDLNKFNRLVKRVNELKETLNELGRSHPNFNKLLTELENTSNEMKRMKSELLSINTALAHIDLSQKDVYKRQVQPFELFFYPVVNLPHGKST